MECHWVITLVHGTWGRGFFTLDKPSKNPRWFEEGSRFMNHLQWRLRDAEVTDVTIEICKWSGANSIVAREQGAQQLAAQLVAQRSKDPTVKQIVVAHSHGGNVAIRSLEHLKECADEPLLVTLATPFLEMFAPEREHFPLDKVIFLYAGFFLAWLFSVVLAGQVLPHPAFKFAIFVVPLLAALVGAREYREHQARKRQIAPASYVDRLAQMTSHEALQAGNTELLVLRGVDDEASLSIAAGALGRRLATFNATVLMNIVGNGWTVAIAFGLMAVLIGLPLWPESISSAIRNVVNDPLFGKMLAYLGVVLLISTFVMTALVAIAAMCLVVYGRELFFSFLNAEISANSVPDSRANTIVHTLLRGSALNHRFRHNIYDDVDCAHHIVQWAKARLAGKPYVSSRDGRRRHPIPRELFEAQSKTS